MKALVSKFTMDVHAVSAQASTSAIVQDLDESHHALPELYSGGRSLLGWQPAEDLMKKFQEARAHFLALKEELAKHKDEGEEGRVYKKRDTKEGDKDKGRRARRRRARKNKKKKSDRPAKKREGESGSDDEPEDGVESRRERHVRRRRERAERRKERREKRLRWRRKKRSGKDDEPPAPTPNAPPTCARNMRRCGGDRPDTCCSPKDTCQVVDNGNGTMRMCLPGVDFPSVLRGMISHLANDAPVCLHALNGTRSVCARPSNV